MKTKFFVISLVILSFTAVGYIVLAGESDIQYPVAELGNCKDKEDCKIYCDNPKNMEACINFAEKNNLMSGEEIQVAKKFMAAGNEGPGGCADRDECEEYCNDMNHINECISFAEENNLMSPEELEEAKKIQTALANGVKPPACGNKEECDVYCEETEHMEECIGFGIAAGFLQGKELEDAQKMLEAIKRGVKPLPCKGKESCDEYCNNPDNMEICITFAIEAGFMSEEEKADSLKMLEAVKKGAKPPNCRGEEECQIYCSQEEHIEECINFSVAAGYMSEEDAAMARKTGGKGPGGCIAKEECEAFCNNPDNQETCFNFAKENGMIPEEDLKQMEEGRQQMQQALQQAPEEVITCLQNELGQNMVEKMKAGEAMPSREMGDKMQSCFQQMGPMQDPDGPGEGGMMPPAGQTGPGGCTSEEECKAYCESHMEECSNFGPSNTSGGPGEGGEMMPGAEMMPGTEGGSAGNLGPGGCTSPEECQNYCNANPQECQNFQPAEQQPYIERQQPTDYMMPAGQEGGGSQQAPPPCTSPEQCQQQMQNQMMIPGDCQGENCQYIAPPSGEQPYVGQQPYVEQQLPGEQQPFVGQQPQVEQQPLIEPQPQIESSSSEPSSSLGSSSLLGSLVQILINFFNR